MAAEDPRERARALEGEGRDEAALDLYTQIIGRDEDPDPSLLVRRANLQWRLGRTGEAADGFARAAVLLGRAGLLHAAVALCERAVRLRPEGEEARARLAELRARAGYGEAGEDPEEPRAGSEDGWAGGEDGLGLVPTLLEEADGPAPPVAPLAGLEPTTLEDGLPLLPPDRAVLRPDPLERLEGAGDTGALVRVVEEVYGELVASGLGSVEALLAIGRRLAAHPDRRLARELLLRVLELDPGNAEAARALAELPASAFDRGSRAG